MCWCKNSIRRVWKRSSKRSSDSCSLSTPAEVEGARGPGLFRGSAMGEAKPGTDVLELMSARLPEDTLPCPEVGSTRLGTRVEEGW
jgi:hypothetical protein